MFIGVCLLVGGNKGVEEELLSPGFDQKAGLAQVGDSHVCGLWFGNNVKVRNTHRFGVIFST